MSQRARDVDETEQLYRLIIGQLLYDGYQTLATSLSNLLKTHPPCAPSDRLFHLAQDELALELEKENESTYIDVENAGCGIDLEDESEAYLPSTWPALYETFYVTSHKALCRAGVFSDDGQLVATGSVDASIKILDVDRMLEMSALPEDAKAQETTASLMETYPVIRTLYDHTQEVTCLEFHPKEDILVSGSRDHTIKFFNFSKPSVKRAFKTFHEADEVRCLSLHPSGDYLLVGTQHPVVRLYDVQTGQSLVSPMAHKEHKGPITAVRYCPNGKLYVTASKDGNMKLWDTVSSKCICTFYEAHESTEVCSLFISRNSKYALTSGKDYLIKIWELSMLRCFKGFCRYATNRRQIQRSQAVFSHNEDYVLYPDERTFSLYGWDVHTEERRNLSSDIDLVFNFVTHSPTSPAFLTYSDDLKVRLWYRPPDSSE